MNKQGRRSNSLMMKFAVIFCIYALVAILISTVFTYFNQDATYKREYKDNLERICTNLATNLSDESQTFSNVETYFKANGDQMLIPIDYVGSSTEYYETYQAAMNKFYPGLIVDKDIAFADLEEEVMHAYVMYHYSRFLTMFENAANSFNFGYTYFLYDAGDNNACYMIDFNRFEKEFDGKTYIDLGAVAYEDPALYPNMWKTFETGERTGMLDRCDTEFSKAYMNYAPVKDAEGRLLGLVVAEADYNLVSADITGSVMKLALISFVVMLICTLISLMVIRIAMIIRLEKLESQVTRYSNEKEPEISKIIREGIRYHDEIGSLSGSVSDMIEALTKYMNDIERITAEREKAKAELEVATHIQASALPCPDGAFADKTQFSLYASMDPAKEVGGDFYDFYMIDDTHIALTIADVSGKGVPGALFMMVSKMLLKNRAVFNVSPKEILEVVNNQLCENNEAEMFVTVWLGILDIETGHMIAANAGHEYPAIRRAGGQYELLKDKHGFVLAGMENARYKEYELQLEPGDSIFVYTDGVAEATDADNQLFGTDRMIESLNSDLSASVKERIEIMTRSIDDFVKDAPQFDDITMLTLDYHGGAAE